MAASSGATLSPQGPSDELLVEQFRAGDDDCLALLVKRYSRLVWSVAQKIVKDSGEAEDLVQTVFLEVFQKISQFDPARGTFRSWLLQLAYTRSINRYHHLCRRNFYTNADNVAEQKIVSIDTRVGSLLGIESGPFVTEMMQVLNRSQRIAVELVCFQGLTFQELAISLGESLANAKHHYYRAMVKMRDALRPELPVSTRTGR